VCDICYSNISCGLGFAVAEFSSARSEAVRMIQCQEGVLLTYCLAVQNVTRVTYLRRTLVTRDELPSYAHAPT
jgi:hypothetical protein